MIFNSPRFIIMKSPGCSAALSLLVSWQQREKASHQPGPASTMAVAGDTVGGLASSVSGTDQVWEIVNNDGLNGLLWWRSDGGNYASDEPLDLWWKPSLQSWLWVWQEQSDPSPPRPLSSKIVTARKYFHSSVISPDNIYISILSLLRRVSWPSQCNKVTSIRLR